MTNWLKRHWWKVLIAIFTMLIVLLFVLPMVIDKIFYINTPYEVLRVNYNIETVLGFYGDILVLIGTVSLGAFTLVQNHIAQEKTDEVNRLTLELQRKSMQLAEERYNEVEIRNNKIVFPKFEVKNQGYTGYYKNLEALMTNVSELYISNLKSLSFNVVDKNKNIILQSDMVHLPQTSLKPGSATRIAFLNEELVFKDEKKKKTIKDITLKWSFQCEDQYSNTHYYRCTLQIEDTKDFVDGLWSVMKVG